MTIKKLFRWLWIILVIIPVVPFIIGSIGFIVYAHWPRNYSSITTLDINDVSEYITISAHGVKDNSKSWSYALQVDMSLSSYLKLQNIAQDNISLDWR